jgi:hypothetical protein
VVTVWTRGGATFIKPSIAGRLRRKMVEAALYGWWAAPWITWLSIGINAALGLWVIHSYRQLLKSMDDLQKAIQLESLSMAFGISLVTACSYSLMVTWGYIQDEEVSDLVMVMCLSFSAVSLFNTWRYR